MRRISTNTLNGAVDIDSIAVDGDLHIILYHASLVVLRHTVTSTVSTFCELYRVNTTWHIFIPGKF